MPSKRPAPLSDELFKAPPVLLGSTNNGVPIPVKNTFLDVPSGFTPVSMKHSPHKLMSAPVMSSSAGFLQKALEASVALGPTAPRALSTVPPPLVSPSGSHYTPLATPTPTGAFSYFSQLAAPAERSPRQQRVHSMLAPQQFYRWSDANVGEIPMPPQQDQPEEEDDDSDDGLFVDISNAPKPPPGALHPSLGSDAHAAGTCKRCCFFPRGRCTNGYECEFCHYDHEKRKRKNKKKSKKNKSDAGAGAKGPDGTDQLSNADQDHLALPRDQAEQAATALAAPHGGGAALGLLNDPLMLYGSSMIGHGSLFPDAYLMHGLSQVSSSMVDRTISSVAGLDREAIAAGQSATSTQVVMLPPAVSALSQAASSWAPPPEQSPVLSRTSALHQTPPPPMESPRFCQAPSAIHAPPPDKSPKVVSSGAVVTPPESVPPDSSPKLPIELELAACVEFAF